MANIKLIVANAKVIEDNVMLAVANKFFGNIG